jgi:hypothetical protein
MKKEPGDVKDDGASNMMVNILGGIDSAGWARAPRLSFSSWELDDGSDIKAKMAS